MEKKITRQLDEEIQEASESGGYPERSPDKRESIP